MHSKEIEELRKRRERYIRLWHYKIKRCKYIARISNCLPKPKGIFKKKCPKCNSKFGKTFKDYVYEFNSMYKFKHYKCGYCYYEYAIYWKVGEI